MFLIRIWSILANSSDEFSHAIWSRRWLNLDHFSTLFCLESAFDSISGFDSALVCLQFGLEFSHWAY